MRSRNPEEFLAAEESAIVEQAIHDAEEHTSAQIKFVIARHCWGRISDKAARVFARMGLHKTAHRNYVLILLVTANREFCIHGDRGIHEQAGQSLWDDVRDRMAAKFKVDAFAEGLAEGIGLIGEKLAHHFPHTAATTNEISDKVGYED